MPSAMKNQMISLGLGLDINDIRCIAITLAAIMASEINPDHFHIGLVFILFLSNVCGEGRKPAAGLRTSQLPGWALKFESPNAKRVSERCHLRVCHPLLGS